MKSVAVRGVETLGVDVEVSVSSRGLPGFDIVGLPDKSVDESRQRVKNAFINSKIDFPNKKVVINLAPADIHKEGSFYDLPIAVGVACSNFGLDVPQDALFFGELSLDGSLRHTRGSFLLALYAKEKGIKKLFVPQACMNEAACVRGVDVYGFTSLTNMLSFLRGTIHVFPAESKNYQPGNFRDGVTDLKDIIDQSQAKRALEIAAAGGHNMIMIGPPGSGKTMLAKAMVGILPPLSEDEAFEITKIYSSVGKILPGGGLVTQRPMRSPHHTISYSGMLGGGSKPAPGEISLAHRGVLFLDEFTEYSRSVLEALRQPLEDGQVTITRSMGSVTYPSKFTLISACNPCPCGYYGHPGVSCKCTPRGIRNYHRKLSGPILDRIDLHVKVTAIDTGNIGLFSRGKHIEESREVCDRVRRARDTQSHRFGGGGIITNSEMTNDHVKKYCRLQGRTLAILDNICAKYSLSVRSYFKLIKISRTIADLEDSFDIGIDHMAEAVHFRAVF